MVIPSEQFYYERTLTPISGETSLVTGQFTPRKPTNVYQGDSTTYAGSTVTLHWTAPVDTGCVEILRYAIQAKIGEVWTEVGSSTTETGVADLSAQKGVLTDL